MGISSCLVHSSVILFFVSMQFLFLCRWFSWHSIHFVIFYSRSKRLANCSSLQLQATTHTHTHKPHGVTSRNVHAIMYVRSMHCATLCDNTECNRSKCIDVQPIADTLLRPCDRQLDLFTAFFFVLCSSWVQCTIQNNDRRLLLLFRLSVHVYMCVASMIYHVVVIYLSHMFKCIFANLCVNSEIL